MAHVISHMSGGLVRLKELPESQGKDHVSRVTEYSQAPTKDLLLTR